MAQVIDSTRSTGEKLILENTWASCGVSVLSGLATDPAIVVDQILKERNPCDRHIKEAFVVFSDVDYPERRRMQGDNPPNMVVGGQRLADYIRDKGLGKIMESSTRTNPNTGNPIKLWVWEPPHEDVKQKYMPRKGYRLQLDENGCFIQYQQLPLTRSGKNPYDV